MPPSFERCHVMVGVGVPLVATVKVALWPTMTSCSIGWVVMVGATLATVTDKVATVDVPTPALLIATARNWVPWSPITVAAVV